MTTVITSRIGGDEVYEMSGVKRISGLDGVRALAIVLVIAVHTNQQNPNNLLHTLTAGQDGVGLFFILSGFLVTALLLREHARRQAINIGHFYFRRAMRILPPLLVYLAFVIAIEQAVHNPVPWASVVSVLLFYHNTHADSVWLLEHTWSLAVEEQFYILWPIVFIVALSISRRTLIIVCSALFLLAPALRITGRILLWGWMHHRVGILLPTRMDSLLAGCLMAILIGNERFEAAYRWCERLWMVAPIYLFILAPYLSIHLYPYYDFSLGYTVNALAGAYFILWLTRNEGSFLGKLANSGPMVRVGIASYSIYLWQTMASHQAHGLKQCAESLLFIAAAATLSYYLVEKPAALVKAGIERMLHSRRAEVLPATATKM